MSNFFISSNMQLPIPTVGQDPGPDWALNLNNALALIDSHNHSSGQGVQINPNGININTDMPFNDNNAISLKSTRYEVQSAVLAGVSDLNCSYDVNGDLYFNDGFGNKVRITQSGGVAGSPGSISGLTSPASASYVSANQTFVWQSDASTPANMDGGSFIFRNISASSKGITVSPPNSLASDYSIVWPSLPVAPALLSIDSSGNMSSTLTASLANTVATTMNSTGTNAIIATMGASGANSIANNRTRATGSTVAVGGIAVSASCGVFSVPGSSPSFTQITNFQVTITTSGRPVKVGFKADGLAAQSQISAGGNCEFVINNDTLSLNVCIQELSSPTSITALPSSSVNDIDMSVAGIPGTYTYKGFIQHITNGGNVSNSVLYAYEL